jgi:hypothetical protein
MRQTFLNLAAGLSLVLCAVGATFWVRSYQFTNSQTGESLSFRRSDPRWWVVSHRGGLTLCRQNGKEWGKEFGDVAGLGFVFGGLRGPEGSLWNLRVPYGFVCGALLVGPVWRMIAVRRRRRRARAGLCLRCGYDLRASPGQCPECGAGAGAVRSYDPQAR